MRRLTHRADGERGAVAIIVALLLPVVLLGMAALTIDVGTISAERRQLQNGADAAALSAAQDCAKTMCPSPGESGLQNLANGNAFDKHTKIARVDGGLAVCGHDAKGVLKPCEANTGTYGDCPAGGPTPTNYVRVYTQTEEKNGSTILPYSIAQAITVGKGTTQQTCSTVAWGTPGSMSATIPFTFSACEWTEATGGDPDDPSIGSYPAAPPYPPYPAATFEKVITLNDLDVSDEATHCETWNGHDVPGGFGWLDDGGTGTCETDTASGDWQHIKTGTGAPSCTDRLYSMVTSGHRTLYIPVYDCMADHDPGVPPVDGQDCYPGTAVGTHVWYHLAGYAQFYLTGYRLAGGRAKSVITGNYPCAASEKCLSGFFLKGLVPGADISTDPTTPSFGLDAIKMVG
jgi:hypothetical protein